MPKPGEMPPAGETPTEPTTTAIPSTEAGSETQGPPTWRNGEPFDPESAEKALEQSRREANRLKKVNEDLQARIQAAADAELSEQERLKKKVAELEQRDAEREQTIKSQRIQLAVERTARELEFVSETAAHRFLDQAQVTFDENDQPTNVKELLTAVLKAEPYLKKPAADTRPTPISAHPTGGTTGGVTPEQDAKAHRQFSQVVGANF
jgi:hypothetical protein